jgi:hypothetical protein
MADWMRRLVGVVTVLACVLAVTAAPATGGTRGDGATPTAEGPVTVGGRPSLLGPDVSGAGYVLEEFFVEGEATAFEPVRKLTANGRWRVEATDTAPFKTRMVMWRPEDPAAFNGTVFAEWLNVSPGFDNPPDWLNGHNYFVREGAVWVGISAQAASVHGDTIRVETDEAAPPPGGLRGENPARYGSLEHPGDVFSYDVFSQAGLALGGDADGANPLEGFDVERVIAVGESQSAFRMTTYVNAIHPIAGVYDGFLIHSRGGQSAPFGDQELGEANDAMPAGVKVRSDLDVPVLNVQMEGDLIALGSFPARQRDSKSFRMWEVAGTAHADAYLAGMSLADLGDGSAEVALLDPAQASGGRLGCAEPINAHGQYVVIMAALDTLDHWISTGTPPAKAPRLEVTSRGDEITIERDERVIARGGVRTPIVDVPIATNDGEVNSGQTFCRLFGHTIPFDAATLAELYPGGEADYVAAFDEAVDRAVEDGYWLEPEAEHYKAAARQITFTAG